MGWFGDFKAGRAVESARSDMMRARSPYAVAQFVERCLDLKALEPALDEAEKGLKEAFDLISRAIAIHPDGIFYINLSQAQLALGRVRESIESCRQAVRLTPRIPEAWNNLGTLLQQAGQPLDALPALQKAIELRPNFTAAHSNLGNALARLGRLDEAIGAYQRALEIDPNDPATYVNFSNLLCKIGRLDESIALSRRAIAMNVHPAAAYANLGAALHSQGYFDEGNEAFQRGVQLDPNQVRTVANGMAGMGYSSRFSQAEVMQAHIDWSDRFANSLAPSPPIFKNDRAANRKLRIAYISPDLKRHSVAYFLEPILEHHDRAQFDITLYSNTEGTDDVTARLRQKCDRWRDIVPLTDEEAAAMIRADGIDILIDLAGHTVGNRLLALAYRPVPIQVTYLGYPGTTGMRAIDYRIVDALTDPPGASDQFHTEKLWRVPAPFIRYRPPEEAPPVVDPPMQQRGQITFGSFNKIAKIGNETIALWSKVLKAVPSSRLILKSIGLRGGGVQKRLFDGFASHDIDLGRIELVEGSQSLRDHLAFYGQIDVALDTFPYHGTTTTCEALWMGVPVISLAGQSHVSRVGVSLLTAIAQPTWATNSEPAYVELAGKLTGDISKLAELRQTLRDRVKTSPLCDAAALTRDLEAAFVQMFVAWAASAR